jgi:hypothetical protein
MLVWPAHSTPLRMLSPQLTAPPLHHAPTRVCILEVENALKPLVVELKLEINDTLLDDAVVRPAIFHLDDGDAGLDAANAGVEDGEGLHHGGCMCRVRAAQDNQGHQQSREAGYERGGVSWHGYR